MFSFCICTVVTLRFEADSLDECVKVYRRRSSAASYRVIGNDRKFRSTDSGGALPRSLSAAELRLGKISGIWQR